MSIAQEILKAHNTPVKTKITDKISMCLSPLNRTERSEAIATLLPDGGASSGAVVFKPADYDNFITKHVIPRITGWEGVTYDALTSDALEVKLPKKDLVSEAKFDVDTLAVLALGLSPLLQQVASVVLNKITDTLLAEGENRKK